MVDFIYNLFYKIRYRLLDHTMPSDTPSYPKGLTCVLDEKFKGKVNWRLFNKYFSTNNEHRHTNLPVLENIIVNDNGTSLVTTLNTDKETKDLYPFKVGYLCTKGKYAQTYGLFELTCKLPKNGLMTWAAFWLYGHPWPPELDIFETMSRKDIGTDKAKTFSATVHSGIDKTSTRKQKGMGLTGRQDLSKEFHKYSLLWTPYKMVWYFDNIPVYRMTNRVPTNPMHVVINTASGVTADKFIDSGTFDLKTLKVYAYEKYNS